MLDWAAQLTLFMHYPKTESIDKDSASANELHNNGFNECFQWHNLLNKYCALPHDNSITSATDQIVYSKIIPDSRNILTDYQVDSWSSLQQQQSQDSAVVIVTEWDKVATCLSSQTSHVFGWEIFDLSISLRTPTWADEMIITSLTEQTKDKHRNCLFSAYLFTRCLPSILILPLI